MSVAAANAPKVKFRVSFGNKTITVTLPKTTQIASLTNKVRTWAVNQPTMPALPASWTFGFDINGRKGWFMEKCLFDTIAPENYSENDSGGDGQIFAVMNDGSVKEMSKRVTVANISQVVKIDYKRRDMTVNDAGLELSPENPSMLNVIETKKVSVDCTHVSDLLKVMEPRFKGMKSFEMVVPATDLELSALKFYIFLHTGITPDSLVIRDTNKSGNVLTNAKVPPSVEKLWITEKNVQEQLEAELAREETEKRKKAEKDRKDRERKQREEQERILREEQEKKQREEQEKQQREEQEKKQREEQEKKLREEREKKRREEQEQKEKERREIDQQEKEKAQRDVERLTRDQEEKEKARKKAASPPLSPIQPAEGAGNDEEEDRQVPVRSTDDEARASSAGKQKVAPNPVDEDDGSDELVTYKRKSVPAPSPVKSAVPVPSLAPAPKSADKRLSPIESDMPTQMPQSVFMEDGDDADIIPRRKPVASPPKPFLDLVDEEEANEEAAAEAEADVNVEAKSQQNDKEDDKMDQDENPEEAGDVQSQATDAGAPMDVDAEVNEGNEANAAADDVVPIRIITAKKEIQDGVEQWLAQVEWQKISTGETESDWHPVEQMKDWEYYHLWEEFLAEKAEKKKAKAAKRGPSEEAAEVAVIPAETTPQKRHDESKKVKSSAQEPGSVDEDVVEVKSPTRKTKKSINGDASVEQDVTPSKRSSSSTTQERSNKKRKSRSNELENDQLKHEKSAAHAESDAEDVQPPAAKKAKVAVDTRPQKLNSVDKKAAVNPSKKKNALGRMAAPDDVPNRRASMPTRSNGSHELDIISTFEGLQSVGDIVSVAGLTPWGSNYIFRCYMSNGTYRQVSLEAVRSSLSNGIGAMVDFLIGKIDDLQSQLRDRN